MHCPGLARAVTDERRARAPAPGRHEVTGPRGTSRGTPGPRGSHPAGHRAFRAQVAVDGSPWAVHVPLGARVDARPTAAGCPTDGGRDGAPPGGVQCLADTRVRGRV